MENIIEKFKDIPNYLGMYQVSYFGNVKSFMHSKEGKILKQFTNKGGYLCVKLYKDQNKKTCRVHKLMAITFLNHIPCGFNECVDHINNIRTDNRIDNLQLISNRENLTKDRFRKETTSKYIGVHFDKSRNKWIAAINLNNKSIHLGRFKSELKASEAYNEALNKININDLSFIKEKKHSSKYTGVYLDISKNKWRTTYTKNGKRVNIGTFFTEKEAYEARENYINTINS
jgi:hypothetical protein